MSIKPATDTTLAAPAERSDPPTDERSAEASERTIRILADLEAGLTYRVIAARQDCGLATVARVAARLETSRAAARKYLAMHALEIADDWLTASQEAAKKGDHRPAKDALLHLGEIDPVAEKQHGGGVTIIVGDGTKPVGQCPDFPSLKWIDGDWVPAEPKRIPDGSE